MAWFDKVMQRLEPFDVTLTLCFTPARAGRTPHHTSPPINLGDFADFCETIVGRYAPHGTELARLSGGFQRGPGVKGDVRPPCSNVVVAPYPPSSLR